MPIADRLWAANRDLADACLHHPFVRQLAGGSLPPDAFRRYVAQDAFFLRAFGRAYATGAARSSSMDQFVAFHQLMGGVIEELKLHRRYAAEFGIDVDDVIPHAATRAYTDFLGRVATQGSPAEAMAAMTPCMRLYAFLGRSLADEVGENGKYGDWIRTYNGDGFRDLVSTLEGILNELGQLEAALEDTYRYALECEFRFFSAPLDSAPLDAAT